MKKVIVFSPHPDDETLGCGGTLLKHRNNGDQLYWCILTYGNEKMGHDLQHFKKWDKIIKKVSDAYQFKKVSNSRFNTGGLEQTTILELTTYITSVIRKIKPAIVYLPNHSDIHTDHQIAFKSCVSSLKSFRNPYIERVLMYETLSETEYSPPFTSNVFSPNVFVDITNTFEGKLKIASYYESEIMNFPFPRSLEALETLAKYRGSRIGVKYAESFMLIFEAWKT